MPLPLEGVDFGREVNRPPIGVAAGSAGEERVGAAADEGVGMQAKRLRVSENIRTACLGLSTFISCLVNGRW